MILMIQQSADQRLLNYEIGAHLDLTSMYQKTALINVNHVKN